MKNLVIPILGILLNATSTEAQPFADLRPVEAVIRGVWVSDSLDERRHPLIVAEKLNENYESDCLDSCTIPAYAQSHFAKSLEMNSGESWTPLESKWAWDLRDIFIYSSLDSTYWIQANPHLIRKAAPSRKTWVWVPTSELDSSTIWMQTAQENYRLRKAEEPEEMVNYYAVEVKPGDCLSHIARRERVSVREIRAWNDLKGDMIYVGQRLLIGGWPNKSANP
jgi:hypothetical protein